MDWKLWCRLCANVLYNNGILFNTIESVLRTKFTISLSHDQNRPETICDSCSGAIQSLSQFAETSLRAETMFNEIVGTCLSEEGELRNLRLKYGFDEGLVSVDVKPVLKIESEEHSVEPVIELNRKPKKLRKVSEDLVIDNGKKIFNSEKTRVNKLFFKFDCHLCPQKFASFVSLRSHCKTNHDSRPRLSCICGSTLSCMSALSRHRSMHLMNTRDDKLTCKLCEEKFTRRMLLDDHNIQVHGLPSELPFACTNSSCSKKFSTQLTLRQHEKIHAKETPEGMSVQCDQCEKRFSTKTRLSGHILSAHVVEKNFICDQCGNGFKTKGALTDHQNSHKNDLIFKCDQCPKAFKHLRGIKRHLDRHNRTEKFICAICQASLSSKDVLQCHMLIHSNEKRFKCHLCSNAYKRTKNLKIHIMSVHTGGTPQYQCPWCDRVFYDGSNCYKHRKNSHPVEFAANQGQEVKKTFLPKLEHLQPQYALSKRDHVTTTS